METLEPTRPAQRARRWMPLALGLVVVIVVGALSYCWIENTQELTIVDEVEGAVAPGETISIDLPASNGCGNQPWELYRSRLGRWQQTHARVDGPTITWVPVSDPVLRWPRSEQHFYAGHCYIGNTATVITIPEDVSWSPVAVCGEAGGPCVEVDIAV